MCKTTSALVPPRSDLPSLPAASQTVVAAAKRLMDRMDAQRAEIAQLLRAVKATLRAVGKRLPLAGASRARGRRHPFQAKAGGRSCHAIDEGAPITLVSQTLGHADLKTTSVYAHARPNDSSSRYLKRT